jgi:hypothetical protein
VDDAVRWS